MAARAHIWGAVSTASGIVGEIAEIAGGIAVGAEGGRAGLAATTVASGKLLVVGALLGSALTAGLGFAVVHGMRSDRHARAARSEMAPSSVPDSNVPRPTPMGSRGPESARPIDVPIDGKADGTGLDRTASLPADEKPRDSQSPVAHTAPSPVASPVPRAGRREDALGREAALVAEASGAMRRGDPEAALALLDAALNVGSHRMEPEELSIRVRALRSLGRDDEAAEPEAALRTKYPDHFLAR
jgi:hypothetical protein